MPTDPSSSLGQRLERLTADMAAQLRRVDAMAERAVDAVFDCDREAAASVIADDEEIDAVDVRIEKAAVAIMIDAAAGQHHVSEKHTRLLLTVVKVNNEAERIADNAVDMAERVEVFAALNECPPQTFRVMANSVVGILDAVCRAFETTDVSLAKVVLASEDAVDRFKMALLRDTQERLAAGECSVDSAFALHNMARDLERMSDHATNIAEQVIYAATGKIVRHAESGWIETNIKD